MSRATSGRPPPATNLAGRATDNPASKPAGTGGTSRRRSAGARNNSEPTAGASNALEPAGGATNGLERSPSTADAKDTNPRNKREHKAGRGHRSQEAPGTRRLALDALIAVEDGAGANAAVAALLDESHLDVRDRALVTELAYGTCRMRRACDWLIDRHTRGRLDVQVRSALRLGTYQLGWTRIPPHAAVSATVEEVRGRGRSVVNAILRRVAEQLAAGGVRWPDPATELSYPDWIVERLARDLGPGAARSALLAMNEAGRATRRADGYFQDRASQLVAAHVAVQPGDRVLDACAAPGGKATAMAYRGPELLVAADRSQARIELLASNVARVNAHGVATVMADGVHPPWRSASFDRVLVDAPCSGLGVLHRRPDARWRVQPEDVARLADLQRRLLLEAIPSVRPGGTLVYSVCTLTAQETTQIDAWLARVAPELTAMPPPPSPWERRGRGVLLLPQTAGTDGMFLLALRVPSDQPIAVR